jgi:hypothetical protein
VLWDEKIVCLSGAHTLGQKMYISICLTHKLLHYQCCSYMLGCVLFSFVRQGGDEVHTERPWEARRSKLDG